MLSIKLGHLISSILQRGTCHISRCLCFQARKSSVGLRSYDKQFDRFEASKTTGSNVPSAISCCACKITEYSYFQEETELVEGTTAVPELSSRIIVHLLPRCFYSQESLPYEGKCLLQPQLITINQNKSRHPSDPNRLLAVSVTNDDGIDFATQESNTQSSAHGS